MIRNVILDFGNVIGSFDAQALMRQFCEDDADRHLLKQAIFHNWTALDAGQMAYADYIAQTLDRLPERLHETAQTYFRDWYRHLTYVDGMPELIADLKEQGVPLYLLSNAPVYFSQHLDFFDVLQGFSGIVVSGDLQMVKPEAGIYTYLLEKYALVPGESLFIDDMEENVEAARKCGLQGYPFDGDTERLRWRLSPLLNGGKPGSLPVCKDALNVLLKST